MTDAEKLKRIAVVLKKHFTNLSVIEVIDLAQEVLTSLEEVK